MNVLNPVPVVSNTILTTMDAESDFKTTQWHHQPVNGKKKKKLKGKGHHTFLFSVTYKSESCCHSSTVGRGSSISIHTPHPPIHPSSSTSTHGNSLPRISRSLGMVQQYLACNSPSAANTGWHSHCWAMCLQREGGSGLLHLCGRPIFFS